MQLRIQSYKGDHVCECDTETARMIFEKLTGLRREPLRIKVPDTVHELEALWQEGGLKYLAANETGELVKDFDPKAEKMIFLTPVTGG